MKLSAGIIILLSACNTTRQITPTEKDYTLGGKMFSSLYQQKAAEYRALCFQGYNIARLRIDHYVQTTNLPKAIITDIDETILDNSPYAVHRAGLGLDYDKDSWTEWTAKGIADTMPGAASFLNYVASKGVEVFYITNRYEQERAGTTENLRRFGLPFADETHLILRSAEGSKEMRRQSVFKTHEVVLLMGDNLADFSAAFDDKTFDARYRNVNQLSTSFGDRFIVFPNTNYGDWEYSILKSYNLSAAQKDSAYKAVLKSY